LESKSGSESTVSRNVLAGEQKTCALKGAKCDMAECLVIASKVLSSIAEVRLARPLGVGR
jgi:hypothetical protein